MDVGPHAPAFRLTSDVDQALVEECLAELVEGDESFELESLQLVVQREHFVRRHRSANTLAVGGLSLPQRVGLATAEEAFSVAVGVELDDDPLEQRNGTGRRARPSQRVLQ